MTIHTTPCDKKSGGDRTSLLGLPEQLLSSALLSRISSPTDFANARLVCRGLASLVPLSMRFLEMKEGNLKSTRSFCEALSNLPNLEALSITKSRRGCMLQEDVNMVAVAAAQHCAKLVCFRLCMRGLRPLWPTVLELLLRLCPHLREVTVCDPEHMREGNSITPFFSFQQSRPCSTYEEYKETGSSSGGVPSLPQHIAMEVDTHMVRFLGRANKDRVAHVNLWTPDQSDPSSSAQGSAAKGVLDLVAQCRAATFLRIAFCEEDQRPHNLLSGPLLFEKLGRLGELRELRSLSLMAFGDFASTECHPLPGSFCNLRHLEELSIEGMIELGDIDVVCHLLRLTKLTVAYTGIPCIPEHISLLANLEILCFNNCGRCTFCVPESLGHLSLLRGLQLSQCMMTSLPDSLAQLQRVTNLNLSGCFELDRLPESLLQMTALKEVNIRGCDDIAPGDYVRCKLRDLVQLHEYSEVRDQVQLHEDSEVEFS